MTGKDGALLHQINTLFNVGAIRELTDGQLLERFSAGPREAAELAFAALVERHGEMVLRVCRAQLDNRHDTDDAFQATFLVLVKKARTLWVRDSLGPWLHQVAFRTAACARSAAARRRKHERRFAEMAVTEDRADEHGRSELENVLHAEITRLPECYRSAIVLCDLQGYTCDEAARRLKRPVGTVKCWRLRARKRLRNRLQRLGLVPSTGLGAVLTVKAAGVAEFRNSAEQTIRAAAVDLFGSATAGEVSVSVRILVIGVLRIMAYSKLRTAAAAVFASVLLTAGLGAFAWAVAEDSGKARDQGPGAAARGEIAGQDRAVTDQKKPAETWSLRLPEAIGIGLQNTPLCRVIAIGAEGVPRKIGPVNGASDLQAFRDEVMLLLCSIEGSYWRLGEAQILVRAAEQAAKEHREILQRKQAELISGTGTPADFSEAAQRLEGCNLDLLTRTSDVITAERQLRNALGLPAVDGRRIVPVTAPTEARLEPDWDKTLAFMLEKHPRVARARALVKRVEGDNSDEGRARLERAKGSLQQVIHTATHSLAREFLQIDATYKQFTTASRLRAAAAQRLDAQRRYYDEGRITIDRFLDAVTQDTTAFGTEAMYRATYNSSLIALELAKGTLLDYYGIDVIPSRPPVSDPIAQTDRAEIPVAQDPVGTLQSPLTPAEADSSSPVVPPPTPATPQRISGESPSATPARSWEGESASGGSEPRGMLARTEARPPGITQGHLAGAPAPSPTAATGGTTFSFQFSVNLGSKPIEFRGSFKIAPAPPASSTKRD
jgi:RNA polymerase sigma factor (sigma-70 family)